MGRKQARSGVLRFILEWKRPDKWGKHRKIDVPHYDGVLVVGAAPKKLENRTATQKPSFFGNSE
jgi:hypothetical protein